MLTLTAAQVQTIARLQALAKDSYHKHDYPGSAHSGNPVEIATLTDSDAVDGGRGLIAQCQGQLSRAVVVAVRYVSAEWIAEDGPIRIPIIVLADGSTWGAPYELTGEITVTAPYPTAFLADDVPDPLANDIGGTLHAEIAKRLTTIAVDVVTEAYARAHSD